jgi:hypothetical protein
MPDEPSPIDKVRSIVQGAADLCQADLKEAGTVPRPEVAFRRAHGWQILVIAVPAQPGADVSDLREIDRLILSLLSQAQVSLSAETLCAKLDRSGWGLFGLSTVKRSLQRLQQMNPPLIGVAKRGRRGYFLLGNQPLFNRPVEQQPAEEPNRNEPETDTEQPFSSGDNALVA